MPRRFQRDWTQDEWNRYFKDGTQPNKYYGDNPVYQELSDKYGWKKEKKSQQNFRNTNRWEGMISKSVHLTVRNVGNGNMHVMLSNLKTEYTSSEIVSINNIDDHIKTEFTKSFKG